MIEDVNFPLGKLVSIIKLCRKMVIDVSETIEERLRREDDAKEVESFNAAIDKINKILPKIVCQFNAKVPKGHVWLNVLDGAELMAAWPLYHDEYKGAIAYISTEGYLLFYQYNRQKDQGEPSTLLMVKEFSAISQAKEKIPVFFVNRLSGEYKGIDVYSKILFTSEYLNSTLSALEYFYKRILVND